MSHTVINDKIDLIGAMPEVEFARKVLEALGKTQSAAGSRQSHGGTADC